MRRVEVKVKVGRGKVGTAKEGRAKGKQEEQGRWSRSVCPMLDIVALSNCT